MQFTKAIAAAAAFVICSGAASVTANATAHTKATTKAHTAAEPPVIVTGPGSAPAGDDYATCPSGTQLAGGGYTSAFARNGAGQPVDALVVNSPSTTRANTWGVRLLTGRVRAFAMCVRSSSPPPVVVQGPLSAPGGVSVATCPAGTTLAGAGFLARPVSSLFGVVDSEVASAPATAPRNSWFFQWFSGRVQARVMCIK